MIGSDIALHIEQKGLALLTSNLFVGGMPDSGPTSCVVVYEYGGAPPSRSSGGIACEHARIQVCVRDPSYGDARDLAERIHQEIDGTGDIEINGTRYLWIEALSPPFLLGRDSSNRVLIACNYDVAKERSKLEAY